MLNSRDLNDLRADVRVNVETLLAMCKAQGLNVLITQTVRDNEYQAYLYAQGRTRPGAIITNSKTTTFHGKGLAVDFCKNVKGHEYDDVSFFKSVAAIAKRIGFSWGGDWKSFVDMPHLQWDNGGKYSTVMLRAGYTAPMMPKYEEKKEDKPMAEKRYNTLDEIRAGAAWAAPTVEKLMETKGADGKPILQGGDTGLDLSVDMLRLLVWMERRIEGAK